MRPNTSHPNPPSAQPLLVCGKQPNPSKGEGASQQNAPRAYLPIACGLYDQLELYAMRGTLLELRFRPLAGENLDALETAAMTKGADPLAPLQLRIADLQTRDSVEYLIADSGRWIRLDRIAGIQPL